MATDSIQARLSQELEERDAFELAFAEGMTYLDSLADRNVFPTYEALANLSVFDEELPIEPTAATEVVELLVRYGAPATTTQLGGRYFGFVTGGATPAGLAAKSLATYWDQNSAMTVMSPVTARLEAIVESWLARLFGLPQRTAVGSSVVRRSPTSRASPPVAIDSCSASAGT